VANLSAKFDVSSYNRSRDMEGGPKILIVCHVTPSRPLLTKFAFLSLGPLVFNLHAKFKVSSFNRSRDMEGVP